MSSSSLWVMDQSFTGFRTEEYGNSWWFSPVVWQVLLDKYMHEEIQTGNEFNKSMITHADTLHRPLNIKMNACDNISDRICWELSNQQVFFTKDKQLIARAIKDFCSSNADYHIPYGETESILALEHIIERFDDIANDILAIDEQQYPHFIFKNTSVDDNIESWFLEYDEEQDEAINLSLRQRQDIVTEFVIVRDDKIDGFISNVDYFNQSEDNN